MFYIQGYPMETDMTKADAMHLVLTSKDDSIEMQVRLGEEVHSSVMYLNGDWTIYVTDCGIVVAVWANQYIGLEWHRTQWAATCKECEHNRLIAAHIMGVGDIEIEITPSISIYR